MATGHLLLGADPYMKNTFHSLAKLEIEEMNKAITSANNIKESGPDDKEKAIIPKEFQIEWELDVRPLVSSKIWLRNYGLKKNDQILLANGFKSADKFDDTVKTLISSSYGAGILPTKMQADGKTFNTVQKCGFSVIILRVKDYQIDINTWENLTQNPKECNHNGIEIRKSLCVQAVHDRCAMRKSRAERILEAAANYPTHLSSVACNGNKLHHLEKRLLHAIYLFKRRIEWLTTQSRRTFGVIEEKSVIIVLNFCSISPQQFNQYMTALENVIKQQVSQLSKFNLIRVCEDMQLYSSECVPVSHDTIENAIKWIWNLDRLASVSSTAVVEAILKALSDKHNEAVYLYTEGASVNSGMEILKYKVNEVCSANNSAPVHVVSFNCDCSYTIKFLREFAESTNGRFHAYAVIMDVDAYETQSLDGTINRANVILKRKTLGGVPPGAGVRKDVVIIFDEMEEARGILEHLRRLREKSPMPSIPSGCINDVEVDSTKDIGTKEEHYMSSKEWLKSYGFEANKLGWQDIVINLAFRHTDTVVDLMHPPPTETSRDAIVEQKLVNARYCDELFPVVKLKDGQVFHVLITPDIYRSYEEKVQQVLNKIQQRIDWLNTGSRALFGTLLEGKVYILIDTSASMENSLDFVKQKIFLLMQEQLHYKRKFNIIAFNSRAIAWKDRLVDVSDHSLRAAWSWVQVMSCSGSTNTGAAIQMATSDPQIEAIYLLTDGRPDQPLSSIICQVKMQKRIPIHTISFNCNDIEANTFLHDLAKITGGRYHYFSKMAPSVDLPQAWESMDITDLKFEIENGLESLEQLSRLQNESSRLMWKKGADELRKNAKIEVEKYTCASASRNVISESTTNIGRRNHCKLHSLSLKRPSTAPSHLAIQNVSCHTPTPPRGQPNTSQVYWPKRRGGQLAKSQQIPNPATVSYLGYNGARNYHTRTRSGRFSPNEWLLPETKKLFRKQSDKLNGIAARTSTGQLRTQTSQQQKSPKLSAKTQSLTDFDADREKKQSTQQWLAKHGLVAKRLTVLDALECTLVSHRAKYVPVLDKYITGKVFNEIMPMAFVSGNCKMYFFNPNGINFKEYENRVRAALDKFRDRLNNIVWDALPSSAKSEFDSDGPISFENNKVKLLQLLKESGWPVPEDDIFCLLDEIAKGEKNISQSKALRKAAAGRNVGDNEKTETRPAPGSSRASSRRSVSADSAVSASQVNGENSTRRSSSVPVSNHIGHFENSGKEPTPDKEMLSARSRSRSHSSNGTKSSLNYTTQSKIPDKMASPVDAKSSISARKRSSSDSSSRSLPRHSALSLSPKEAASPATTPKNLQIDSLFISDSDCGSQLKNLTDAVSTKQRKSKLRSHFLSREDALVNLEKIPPEGKESELLKGIFVEKHRPHKKMKRKRMAKVLVKRKHVSSPAQEQVRNLQTEKVKDRSQLIKGKVLIKLKALKGQRVIARREEDGLYYPAVVLSCPDPKRCIVHFENDNKQVLTSSVLPQGGAVSCPPLYVDDCVLVKVVRLDTMLECFVPALIQAVPQSHSDDRFYTVIMYNGQQATTKRRYLVKISRKQFDTDCVCISSHWDEIDEKSQTNAHRKSRHRNRRKRPDDRLKKPTRPRSFPGVDITSVSSRSCSSSQKSNSLDRSIHKEQSERERSNSSSFSRSSKKIVSLPNSRNSVKSESPKGLRSDCSTEREDLQKNITIDALNKEQDDTLKDKVKKHKKRNKKRKKPTSEPIVTSVPGSENDTPQPSWWLLDQRMSLQKQAPLLKGEHVLARWADDGWYYRGTVTHYFGNCSYEIEDNSGYIEQIWREDIFQDKKDQNRAFEVDDHVIALHSKYNCSYAPGIIEEIDGSKVKVQFYDNQVSSVQQQEVYCSTIQKYKLDVKYIKRKEDELIKSAVVARCDESSTYLPGTVVAKCDDGKYEIQWASGIRSNQQVIHIFGAFSRRPKIQPHSRILACSDPVLLMFLPGTITNCRENSFSVKFCDGTRQDNILPDHCYWLNESYYQDAVEFCKQQSLT